EAFPRGREATAEENVVAIFGKGRHLAVRARFGIGPAELATAQLLDIHRGDRASNGQGIRNVMFFRLRRRWLRDGAGDQAAIGGQPIEVHAAAPAAGGNQNAENQDRRGTCELPPKKSSMEVLRLHSPRQSAFSPSCYRMRADSMVETDLTSGDRLPARSSEGGSGKPDAGLIRPVEYGNEEKSLR